MGHDEPCLGEWFEDYVWVPFASSVEEYSSQLFDICLEVLWGQSVVKQSWGSAVMRVNLEIKVFNREGGSFAFLSPKLCSGKDAERHD